MAIRKPNLSVNEARRLANIRSAASGKLAPPSPPPPSLPASESAVSEPMVSEPAVLATVEQRAPGSALVLASEVHAPPAHAEPTHTEIAVVNSPPKERRQVKPNAVVSPPRRPAPPPFIEIRLDKVQVFLSAPIPAQGVSAIFEMLCQQYPPQKALQMIMRKALGYYDRMLEDGSFQMSTTTYAMMDPTGETPDVHTSRMMSKPLLSIARAHFDPLGMESSRVFGRKLATAALTSFFTREARR